MTVQAEKLETNNAKSIKQQIGPEAAAQPSPSQQSHKPSTKKLRKKVKTRPSNLKTIWLAGHIMTLFFGLVYSLYYFKGNSHKKLVANLAYKCSFFGVWISYALSIQSSYNLKSLPHYSTLLATENFQFFLLSIVWVFNRNSIFKLIPYLIISVLQLSLNFQLDQILKFEQSLSATLMYTELVLFFTLLFDTLLMRGTSGYGLVIYVMFIWLRVLQRENTRFFLYAQFIRLDNFMSKIKNPKIASVWQKIKRFLSYKQANFEQKFL
jgi:hypothetical protein